MNPAQMRLDASESAFLERSSEAVAAKVYAEKFEALKARRFIPILGEIPTWGDSYRWSELTEHGALADFIANMADDLPRADVARAEHVRMIRPLGQSYGWDLFEVKRAAMMGVPLESWKGIAARRRLETKIDTTLALGSSAHGLEGLLNLTGASSFTPGTKDAGGLTWGTLAAPNASGEEVANDLMGIASKAYEDTKEQWDQFTILLPVAQYNYAAQKRLGDGSNVTALAFAKATSPFIADVQPWAKTATAGAGSGSRMVCYPKDPDVVAGLVPMEPTILPVQERNLKFVVNMIATCGGVISRYPYAVFYGDGI